MENKGNIIKEITKRNNETQKQYEFRLKIYKNVYDDLKDKDKAIIYSNIWVNIFSLDCKYPDEVMENVEKYRPDDKDNVYLIEK
jgi:hypothetical protein